MLLNRLTYATTLLGIFAFGCSSGSTTPNGDNDPNGSFGSEESAGPNHSGAGGAEQTEGEQTGGASSSGGATSSSTSGTSIPSSGGNGSGGGSGGTGGTGTGGETTVPAGHLPPHCEAPDAGEVFCVENGNGYPGDTVTLPYYFYYSSPHDGLASGTAVISLPDGFSLANPAPAGVDLCGHLTSEGATVNIQFNPIDFHWQQGSDCPLRGTQFEVYQMEVTIDASVSPGDYDIAIPVLTMSGAQGGAPEIPPGPSSQAPGVIRVLEN